MDKTARYFDKWATMGRSEDMEIGHGFNVNKFLDSVNFVIKPLVFTDLTWVFCSIVGRINYKGVSNYEKNIHKNSILNVYVWRSFNFSNCR